MDALDIDAFRRPPGNNLPATKKTRLPRHKRGEWFLKGPIPGGWLSLAASLSGKTLHVALACWFLVGLENRRQVKVTKNALAKFGAGTAAGRRGLKRLEAAGLISVERMSGRCPKVTMNDLPST